MNSTRFSTSFLLYKTGVLTASCSTKLFRAFAVGFGTNSGTNYWTECRSVQDRRAHSFVRREACASAVGFGTGSGMND